jgi:hypothetical protein
MPFGRKPPSLWCALANSTIKREPSFLEISAALSSKPSKTKLRPPSTLGPNLFIRRCVSLKLPQKYYTEVSMGGQLWVAGAIGLYHYQPLTSNPSWSRYFSMVAKTRDWVPRRKSIPFIHHRSSSARAPSNHTLPRRLDSQIPAHEHETFLSC